MRGGVFRALASTPYRGDWRRGVSRTPHVEPLKAAPTGAWLRLRELDGS